MTPSDLQMTVLYTEEQIAEAVQRVAQRIRAHWADEDEVHVVALMNGALWFAADLLRELPPTYTLHTLRVSSYGHAYESSGRLQWLGEMPELEGKRVLLVDDVIDTGLTLKELSSVLRQRGALEVRSAVAVDKCHCRRCEMEADFVALQAGGEFLVGYGMDVKGCYRNLPFIAIAEL